jgi:hypothetical protein
MLGLNMTDVTVASTVTIAITGWWWYASVDDFCDAFILLPPFLLLPLCFPFLLFVHSTLWSPAVIKHLCFMSYSDILFMYCLRCAADVMWKKHKKETLY